MYVALFFASLATFEVERQKTAKTEGDRERQRKRLEKKEKRAKSTRQPCEMRRERLKVKD